MCVDSRGFEKCQRDHLSLWATMSHVGIDFYEATQATILRGSSKPCTVASGFGTNSEKIASQHSKDGQLALPNDLRTYLRGVSTSWEQTKSKPSKGFLELSFASF